MTRYVKHRNGGFTLTELLVAMAIFSVLTAALVTLFTSAVHSVRTGYASIAAHEQARVAMRTMSRDLTMAFTGREFGDVYNFYGRHDGFMFVGGLNNGDIGRVTYAFHDELPGKEFDSIVTMRWGAVVDNVRRQAERIARQHGYYGDDLADRIVEAQTELENAIGTYAPNELVELGVEIVPQRLIRYEEPGIGDLDTFNMRVSGLGAPQTLDLSWPYIDPIEPLRDDPPPGDADGDSQRDFLHSSVVANTDTFASDLRDMYRNINQGGGVVHPVTSDRLYLRVLGRNTFQHLINARKREFWIRMLSGDTFDMPTFVSTGGYWHDEESVINNANLRKKVINEYVVADGIIGHAYLLGADGNRVEMFTGGEPGNPIAHTPIDALDADVKFSYGTQTRTFWGGDDRRDNDGDDVIDEPGDPSVGGEQSYFSEPWSINYFNAIENLGDPDDPFNQPDGRPYLRDILANGQGPVVTNDQLVYADNELANDLLGNRSSRRNLGSLLAPRLPEAVTMEIWVTRSKRHPNSPDFQRRFSQTVQLPAATGRSATSTLALGPGSSL